LQALNIYNGKRDFDVKLIWLKRDLRATAVSKSKWKELNVKKAEDDRKTSDPMFLLQEVCFAVSGYILKRDLLQINYEDLAQQTQQGLDRITRSISNGSL
jgi:hypothetical protein